jgi:hypothetical protein
MKHRAIDLVLQEVSNWERNKTEIEEHEGNVMEWRVLLLDSTPSCVLMHFALCTCFATIRCAADCLLFDIPLLCILFLYDFSVMAA